MKKLLLTTLLSWGLVSVYAQEEISYELSFNNAVHHEAEVDMRIPNISSPTLSIRMSRSSPGRYATHEFGKNIYNFKAFDQNGKQLVITRQSGDEYNIKNIKPGSTIRISYTLFGNWVDGTYAAIDETHAHLNIPASFAYPVGMDKRARIVNFNMGERKNWKVVTQLKPLAEGRYFAKDLQYFMDSPIELSDFNEASWQVSSPAGKSQKIHVVCHSKDNASVVTNFAKMVKKVVDEQIEVWGELPSFDQGNYYFLHDVYPTFAGDGMEHRNSTVIVQKQPKIEGNESAMLATFSHEFFHAWNVERLRPKSLEPFKFDHANISEELWFAEGFTQYYGNLILARAGFRTLESFSMTLSGIVNTVLNTPGAIKYSPVDASRYAVFADAGVAIDQTNKTNIFTTYYTYGAAVALALDLRLRSEFHLSLDNYMRALWRDLGKIERPYSIADLKNTLAKLTGNEDFAQIFFQKYIFGTEKNNYQQLLYHAGFVLQKSSDGKAFSGLGKLNFENNQGIIGQTSVGSPAYLAGLDLGATLIAIDGVKVSNQDEINDITEKHKPGDRVRISYTYFGEEKTTMLTFSENPMLEIVPIEKIGGKLTTAMAEFREKWLASQIKK